MNQRHNAAPAVIAGACLLVLLAGYLFLQFGPNRTAVYLESPEKAAALDGFSLHGSAGDDTYRQRFRLENGVLENEFTLRPDSGDDALAGSLIYCTASWEIDPAVRDSVDAAAELMGAVDNRSGQVSAASSCNRFVEMFSLALPDGTTVSFPSGETLQTEKPVRVEARPGSAYFYSPQFSTVNNTANGEYATLPYRKTLYGAVCDGKTFVLTPGGDKQPPTLYEVSDGLSLREVERLPKNGTVRGESKILRTEPYGTLKKIKELPRAMRVANILSVGDRLAVAFWENDELCVLLMRLDGTVIDRFASGIILEGTTDIMAWEGGRPVEFAPRQAADEICLSVRSLQQPMGAYVIGLRVQEDAFVASCVAQYDVEVSFSDGINGISAIDLKDDNTALLVAMAQNTGIKAFPDDSGTNRAYLPERMLLAVLPDGANKVQSSNALRCNQADDRTGSQVITGINFAAGKHRRFVFDGSAKLNSWDRFVYFRF